MKRPERAREYESLDQLTERFCQEVREGLSPSVEEYATEHPAHAAEIRELFPAFELLEQSGRSYLERVDENDLSANLHQLVAISHELGAGSLTPEIIERLAQRGETFNRYTLKGEIASGGQGSIFRVWDEDLHRPLAMKIVHGRADRTGETPHIDSKTVGRFLDEAQVTGQLDHPGIVPVHELGLDDHGRVYFTMKLVRGRDLKHVFELVQEGQEGWTLTRALGVVLKVCEAMAYAHAKGVIHRDLKPSNVMVGKYGEVYVMDWGLARILGEEDRKDIRIQPEASVEIHSTRHFSSDVDSSLITMDGDVVGTPAYMAPEQARGELQAVGPQSDVYSVGAMLYHLLSGQAPYVPPGVQLNNRAVWMLVQKGPPVPLHELARDVPAELVAISEKAMARHPSARYANVQELAEELRAYLENRVVRAYRSGAVVELQKWIQRNKALAAALAAALVFLVAGLGSTAVVQAKSNQTQKTLNQSLERRQRQILGLADQRKLDQLEAREAELWPAVPAEIPAMETWLADADALAHRVDVHREQLELVRAGLSGTGEDAGVGETEEELSWLEENLVELVDGIEGLEDPDEGAVVRVKERLRFAGQIEELSTSGDAVAGLWRDAIASISDPGECPDYGGLVIRPQLGLVPLGKSPWSGLWEFWHVASGERPRVDDDEPERYALEPGDGIVLVLLPGGPFERGSPDDEPGRGSGRRSETLHHVVLKPFFMGKYEVTQAQWLRVFGENPSKFQPGEDPAIECSLLQPVERVTWHDGTELARRLGLRLPTESQWEYACRAGSRSAYPEGDDFRSFEGLENIGDLEIQPYRPAGSSLAPWDDGFPFTAPVGSFPANAFGLHDMNGNVAEWCDGTLDPYPGDSDVPTDGRIMTEESGERVWRGGFWHNHPDAFRSAARFEDRADGTNESRGLRVARGLDL